MKKLLALIMALMLVACVFAGCGGGGDDGSAATLKWAIAFSETQDYPEVIKEVNKKLETLLPNTELELVLDAQLGSKWSLWMAGGTPIDLVNSGWQTELYGDIATRTYHPLDDLVAEYAPNIKTEWEKYDLEYASGTYNGKLYAIPNVQYHTDVSFMLALPNDLAEYLDVDAVIAETHKQRKTTEKVYQLIDEFLTKAYASGKLDTDDVSNIIDVNRLANLAKRGYDFIGGDESNICYDVDDENCKLIDFHTTEEFKTFIKYAEKWYKAGYVSKDILTGAGPGNRAYVIQYTSNNRGNIGGKTTGVEKYSTNDADCLWIDINNKKLDYLGVSRLGYVNTYTSIPSTSENPERAIKFLNILHSEEGRELMNLICYGIEGKHYDVVDAEKNYITPYDYAGQPTSSAKYGISNWMIGNIFFADICYPLYDEEYVNYANDYFNRRKDVTRTKVFKFAANMDNIATDLAQIKAVNEEYESQLISGSLSDMNAKYDQMLSKCEAAGQSKIIAELQKQIDEYIKG